MTDREKLKALLTEFGVEIEEKGDDIFCREGGRRIKGHSYFYTVFKFKEDGSFESMGAYEL